MLERREGDAESLVMWLLLLRLAAYLAILAPCSELFLRWRGKEGQVSISKLDRFDCALSACDSGFAGASVRDNVESS